MFLRRVKFMLVARVALREAETTSQPTKVENVTTSVNSEKKRKSLFAKRQALCQ